jgi:hypothetical protein
MEREKPIALLGFSGKEERSFGKYFAPLLDIKVEDHVSQVSCETGPLEKGDRHNHPGGMVYSTTSNAIQRKWDSGTTIYLQSRIHNFI